MTPLESLQIRGGGRNQKLQFVAAAIEAVIGGHVNHATFLDLKIDQTLDLRPGFVYVYFCNIQMPTGVKRVEGNITLPAQ